MKPNNTLSTTAFAIDQIKKLPVQPGIYKFYNAKKKLIYVGKAKNLKKRVTSYFSKQKKDRKTTKMVSEIRHIEFAIVNTEFDAFLLENNLIKKNQPKYNILLKDDKSYPFICITPERFPRIISKRNIKPASGKCFGPFSNVKAMNSLLDLIQKLYTIRSCKLNLSEKNIEQKKFKVCLEYHIGNCKGPCENLQTEKDYNKDIEQATHILKGNLNIARQFFKDQMLHAASDLAFEKAQEYKEKLELLDNFHTKSLVVSTHIKHLDVFTIVTDEKNAYINYLNIKSGSIILAKSFEVQKKLNEQPAHILTISILQLREIFKSQAPEIITNIPLDTPLGDLKHSVPQIGDKKKLIDISLKNALFFKKEKYEQKATNNQKIPFTLAQLQQDLNLKEVPTHIECFDNSNIQGKHPVASMVCFINGKPSKKNYRKFHVKTVEGPDDFASMEEIVIRRYARLKKENLPLPNLIIIDGGKGQLNAACKSLKKLNIYGTIPIIGIAKRLEELYFPGDELPLHLHKKSESLKLIQRIRNEAHRFAITFHRDVRSKASLHTQLEEIPGIGKKTIDVLLQKYHALSNIKKADLKELSALIGNKKANLLKLKLAED